MTPYRHQEVTDLCGTCRQPADLRCLRCRQPTCPEHHPEESTLCGDCHAEAEVLVERHLTTEDEEPQLALFAVACCIVGLPVAALFLPMDIALSLLCGGAAVMAPTLAPVARTYRDWRRQRLRCKLIERFLFGESAPAATLDAVNRGHVRALATRFAELANDATVDDDVRATHRSSPPRLSAGHGVHQR